MDKLDTASTGSGVNMSRRRAGLGLLALGASAACSNGVGSNGAAVIDARVDSTVNFMFNRYPGTQDLAAKSTGMLVMPVITEVGLGIGGGFGRGALRVNNITVDYYSAASASAGFQIGAQQYAHVFFFMTQPALLDFRRSSGWSAGADVEYAFRDEGQALKAGTVTALSPVVAVIFGQAGLRLGATLEGTKYTRIIP